MPFREYFGSIPNPFRFLHGLTKHLMSFPVWTPTVDAMRRVARVRQEEDIGNLPAMSGDFTASALLQMLPRLKVLVVTFHRFMGGLPDSAGTS